MLKQFFTQPKVLRRLQEGVFGPYLPAFAVSLQQEGYSKGCIRRHLRAADRFGAWLSQQKLTLSDLTRALVKRYIEGRGRLYSASRPNGALPHNAQGLHELTAFLNLQGVIAPTVEVPLTSAGQWLSQTFPAPILIARPNPSTGNKFFEFFTVPIRNANTRQPTTGQSNSS
jgi:hypothetical protein